MSSDYLVHEFVYTSYHRYFMIHELFQYFPFAGPAVRSPWCQLFRLFFKLLKPNGLCCPAHLRALTIPATLVSFDRLFKYIVFRSLK
jgi:hypothetical protein